MSTIVSNERNANTITLIYNAIILYLTVIYLVVYIIPSDMQGIFAKVSLGLSLIAVGIFLYKLRGGASAELKLLMAYGAWFIITRLINKDFNTTSIILSTFYLSVMSCCYFAAGQFLCSERRDKLLNWLSFLLGAILFVYAVLGVFVALTNADVWYIPALNEMAVHIGDESAPGSLILRYVKFFDINRNISSAWFLVGLCLMIYQFFACRQKAWKVPIALAGFFFYLIVALQHCRSVQVATAISMAMLLMLLVYRRVYTKKLGAKILCVSLAALVGVVGFYFSLSLLSTGISKISDVTAPRYAEYVSHKVPSEQEQLTVQTDAPVEVSTNVDAAETNMSGSNVDTVEAAPLPNEGAALRDTRKLSDVGTLNQRVDIWKAIFPAIKEKPIMALFGENEKSSMILVNKYCPLADYKNHMHNMFLQVLLLTGIPGLLLCAAFCVLLIIKMVKYFFSTSSEATIARKCLILPLAGLFIYGMLEPMIFTKDAIYTVCFFLISGVFVANFEGEKQLEK